MLRRVVRGAGRVGARRASIDAGQLLFLLFHVLFRVLFLHLRVLLVQRNALFSRMNVQYPHTKVLSLHAHLCCSLQS
eukprot:361643-Rhodomonas_salina.1